LNSTKKSWTLSVEEDTTTGDAILNLPDELLTQAGWQEGDVINWIDNKDGTWSLFKEDLTSFIHKGIINDEQN